MEESGNSISDAVHLMFNTGHRLQQMGKHILMGRFGAQGYGMTSAPVPTYIIPNVKFTHKPGKLYVHVIGDIKVFGVRKVITLSHFDIDVKKAYYLANPGIEVPVTCIYTESSGVHRTTIQLDDNVLDEIDTVICIEYNGNINVEPF